MRANRGELLPGALAFCLVLILGLSVAVTPTRAQEANRYFKEGVAYLKKGQWNAAIASLKEAVRLKPDVALSHALLGLAYSNKGQYDLVIASYKEAIRLKPDYADVHLGLGNAYLKKGQWDDAIASFKEAIRLNPDVAVFHYSLGAAYVVKGDRKAALVEYEWLKTRKPGLAEELLSKIHSR